MSIKDASRLMASLRLELKNPKQNKKAIRNLIRVARAEIDARYKLRKAKENLPQGDPSIPALEQALETASNKLNNLDKKVVDLRNAGYKIVTGNSLPASSTMESA